MGYLDIRANFGLPGPLCSRLRPDVRDRRQTSVRQKHRLMPRGGQGFIQTPQGGGVKPPSFHATPQQSEVQRGLSGGVYVIVMEWVINVVKY